LSIALLAHVSCAIAGPIAKAAIMAAKTIRFMGLPPVAGPAVYSKNFGSQQPQHIADSADASASGPIASVLRHRRNRRGVPGLLISTRVHAKPPFAADYQFGGRFSMNARTPS
jgi:hypothetical protein